MHAGSPKAHGDTIEPYQSESGTEAVAEHATNVLMVLSPLAGKGTGVGVLSAESKGTTVTSGHLVRFGKGPETSKQLAADAARAEAAGFPHGVSTKLVNRVSGSDKAHRSAPKAEVEKHFRVEQTGKNPSHHTVRLPKPVTRAVADKFNKVFKPKD